ncbi:hypothetical protein F5Y18DRAFT_441711 [Xylariaceae sp. FL1019]|nr:hypothetical protein F5Y18DRAFT_441711 [Xylariaceae sp. FL1019]
MPYRVRLPSSEHLPSKFLWRRPLSSPLLGLHLSYRYFPKLQLAAHPYHKLPTPFQHFQPFQQFQPAPPSPPLPPLPPFPLSSSSSPSFPLFPFPTSLLRSQDYSFAGFYHRYALVKEASSNKDPPIISTRFHPLTLLAVSIAPVTYLNLPNYPVVSIFSTVNMPAWNTLRTPEGTPYRPIRSDADAQQQRALLMEHHDETPRLPPQDLPTQADLEYDAMFVLQALVDQRFAKKEAHKTAWTALYVTRRYSMDMMRLVAWSIVTETANAAKGILRYLPCEDSKDLVYQQFAGYIPRLLTIVRALRLDKGVVKQCFDSESFAAKLAWNPGLRARRSLGNTVTNANQAKKRKAAEALLAGTAVEQAHEDQQSASIGPEEEEIIIVNEGELFRTVGLRPSPPLDLDAWHRGEHGDEADEEQ